MSGIINMVKDALSGDSHTTTTTEHTTGTTGTTGPIGTTGTAGNTHTTHTTGAAGNSFATGLTGATGGFNESSTTTAGPHSSNLANKVDPRVDSDLDGRGNHYTTTTGGGVTGAGNTYSSGTTGTSGVTGGSAGAGPHSSSLLNKLDPRVDSTTGAVKTGTTQTGNTYSSGTTGTTGTTRTTGTTGTTDGYNTSTNAGPHSSGLANKLDPRVDSNLGGRDAGYGNTTGGGIGGSHTGNNYTTGTTGTTGGLSSSTNAGPHDSNIANKVDPRVDSDLDGRGNRHGATTGGVFGASGSHATPGQGTAQNTAGPHNSDLMNKVDPRVDSDMDGSATAGRNRTYASTENKDPLDAAHVPPSVLRQSLGAPIIAHDNPHHDHQGCHGSMSHQEAHLHRGSEAI